MKILVYFFGQLIIIRSKNDVLCYWLNSFYLANKYFFLNIEKIRRLYNLYTKDIYKVN